MRTCMQVCVRECMCARGVCSCMHARLRCQCIIIYTSSLYAYVHEVYVHACMCLHVSHSLRGASWVMTRRHGRAGRLVRKTLTYLHEGRMTSSTTVRMLVA